MKNLFWIYALNSLVYWIQDFEGLPGLSLFKYFKENLNWSPEKLMIVSSLLGLAWIPKILWGILIDNYLSKKTWIVITLIIDSLTVLFLGIWSLPLVIVLTLIFFNNSDSAIRDVATDAIMCVEGKKHNITGKIQSVQWISITASSILTSFLGGYIADHYDYRIGFLLILPFYLLCIIPLINYKENKSTRTKNNFILKIKNYILIFKNKNYLWVCLFILLYNFSPSFGTSLVYIERDVFKWSYQFKGILGAIGSISAIIGFICYAKISSKINPKKWLFAGILIGTFITLCYLYYTPISAIVYSIVFSFIGSFFRLISLDVMAKNSISKLEASSFALLCGVSNLGGFISLQSGAFLLPLLGLKKLIVVSAILGMLGLLVINKLKEK